MTTAAYAFAYVVLCTPEGDVPVVVDFNYSVDPSGACSITSIVRTRRTGKRAGEDMPLPSACVPEVLRCCLACARLHATAKSGALTVHLPDEADE